MTLTIQDETISSDTTRHTARLAPGHEPAWQVSWLPGRLIDRNSAITAIVLAEVVTADDVHRRTLALAADRKLGRRTRPDSEPTPSPGYPSHQAAPAARRKPPYRKTPKPQEHDSSRPGSLPPGPPNVRAPDRRRHCGG